MMMVSKFRNAPPRASAMIEALRGLGYSTATALADIIDNSIAAKAKNVELTFSWNGDKSHITVLDDGCGMDDVELERAMRLGDKSPLDKRDSHDLGRFGLGLKTASFSQCRSLTVASKKEARVNCLRWDLDILATSKDDGWHLLEGAAPDSDRLLDPIAGQDRGTLVLLEKLDRIVTSGFKVEDFLDLVDNVEQHLAMVFHRYLEDSNPKLKLVINGRPVAPWDPFLSNHPTTWTSPVERLNSICGTIEVQCHVLPHKDKLDQREHDIAAGPDGWTAQQGFYVYRNKRLLVAGSWLGLGQGRSWTKEEAHRLARIRLDIPNSADADWKIDIRKSTARPPVLIRTRLTRLAEDTRMRARRVFAHRGQAIRVGDSQPVTQAWRSEHFNGGMRYRIDDTHPAVRAVLDEAGVLKPQIKAMLRIIEETIPVQRIWLDTTEARETPVTGFEGVVPAEVKSVLEIMFRNMVYKKGMSAAFARERLLHTEPFHNYPDLVAALPDEPILEGEAHPCLQ
jgi:hypothetical protein